MPKGFVYILECSDGSYYTGSTIDIEKRLIQHQEGLGANHTQKRLPIKLVYLEEFQRIDDAFMREKQIQGWNRSKKEALIYKNHDTLPDLSIAYRDKVASRTSATTRASATNKMTLRSNGKLLITGEYVVLDGAKALALPTKYGQYLECFPGNDSKIEWESYDHEGNVWFQDHFSVNSNQEFIGQKDQQISDRLSSILNAAKQLNPEFLKNSSGAKVKSHLEFPRDWGLGSSSTLINNIANWAQVDAYKLLEKTFKGSGYDIACAQNNSPILYQLQGNKRLVSPVDFKPSFSEHLYFVHLNQKQDSREGINRYNTKKGELSSTIAHINRITEDILQSHTLDEFNALIDLHETIIGSVIQQAPVKVRLFKNYNGSIKSLGAWGGDFVLVSSKEDPSSYFKSKGYHTVIRFNDMVLS